MDIYSKVVHKTDAFGCKVTHDIDEPDWVLLMDEVGGNTNQKGDGQVGGELQMCERGTVPQRKINTKDRHYTVLGLTTLAGKPVMCVVIFAGETPCTLVETGLDLEAETEGHPDNADFFEKNLDAVNVSQVAPLAIIEE